MKTLYTICFSLIVLFLSGSNSYSQLNGTYIVGSGGNYPTINSAANAAVSLGVNGPVIFNIISGNYTDQIFIDSIAGSSSINTVTFKSQTGNPADVKITTFGDFTIRIDGADNINIEDITFSNHFSNSFLAGGREQIKIINRCDNIKIINNIFNQGFTQDAIFGGNSFSFLTLNNILIKDNLFISGGGIAIESFSKNIKIINNNFPGISQPITIISSDSILIEKNFMNINSGEGLAILDCRTYIISKNIIIGDGLAMSLTRFGPPDSSTFSIVSNNFIKKNGLNGVPAIRIQHTANTLFIYNTFYAVSNVIAVPAAFITFLDFCANISLINNLIIKTGSGYVYSDLGHSVRNSDYNDFHNDDDSSLIYYNGISYNNVTDFYNSTGLDQHSNSPPVTFVSPTDLHLAGSSIGDIQLEGIPNALVTDDIDGNPRSPLHPYKGADEPDVPLPVELSLFTSSIIKNNVTLKWTTSLETNNSGFDVERSVVNGQWQKIGFVQGNGNTMSPKNYEFTDRNLLPGKYNYRLKQIDYSGNFEYHNLSNEVVIGVPTEFRLSQNYPNPFNPSTTINYDLPAEARVRIVLYDLSGREVMILLNETKTAGYYTLNFNGSNLSSGVYFYSIIVTANEASNESFKVTKRMMFLK